MKKNRLSLLVLAVLVVLSAYYFFTNKSGTLSEQKGAKSNFAIEDTASIDKIFMVDSKGQTLTLVKLDKGWRVNDKYDARPDNIRLLMKTFSRIAVKSPVPNSAFKTIVKNIATGSTKVEIYQGNNKPSKVYYVGNSTMDQQGTNMLLEVAGEKSSVPYVMHIPGFRGYLTSRFFTDEAQWRDAYVFRYDPKDIKKIEVTLFETPEESFSIDKAENGFELKDSENKKVEGVSSEILNEYVSRYKKIYYEMIDVESTEERKDSIVASEPYFQITVEDVEGTSVKLVSYHMPNFRTLLDKDGEKFKYDVDRMYGYLDKNLFVFIQFATFDQLTIPRSYFKK
jgi:hypothetical protein